MRVVEVAVLSEEEVKTYKQANVKSRRVSLMSVPRGDPPGYVWNAVSEIIPRDAPERGRWFNRVGGNLIGPLKSPPLRTAR